MPPTEKEEKALSRRAFFNGIAAGAVGGLVVGGAGEAFLKSRSEPKWDKEADVVIVGGGASGLASAVSALQSGAKVIVLESAPVVGGAGSLCIGTVTVPLSSLQKQEGIRDSVEDYMENILEMAGHNADRIDKVMLRILAENGGATIDWLLGLGVNIQGPFDYPEHKVKRMHVLYPKSAEWPKVIRPYLERQRVEILLGTKGIELYRDANNRVLGVKALDKDTNRTISIKARRAVMLTAGNLEANPAMVGKFTTPEIAALPVAVPTNDGSGLMMAAALGANMNLLELTSAAHLSGAPPGPAVTSVEKQHWQPYGLVGAGAIIVNKESKRFVNEEEHGLSLMCVELNKQPYKIAYMVFDKRVADLFNAWPMVIGPLPGIGDVSKIGGFCTVDDLIARKGIKKADTLEGLAEAVGLDPAALKLEIEKWNGYCKSGKDPDFNRPTFGHKDANTLGAGIRVPPFYCHSPLRIEIGPAWTTLSINTNFQVLDVFGRVIPGLYAGGNMGHNHLFFTGHGMHMAWAFTSGRLGGKLAAAEKPWA